LNQAELEQEMSDGGRAAAMSRFGKAEEANDAASNPYATAVFRRFIKPLAAGLDGYLNSGKRGVAAKSKVLLQGQDTLTLAYITIRGVLNNCLSSGEAVYTAVAAEIGRTVYSEVALRHFEDINPELYYTLVQDLERRMTKSERHRFNVMKSSAEKDGLKLPIWDIKTKVDVGTLLTGAALDIGLIEVYDLRMKGKTHKHMRLHPDMLELVEQIKGFVAGASPFNLPCVEPPRPWSTPTDGGWHTLDMKRTLPSCVRGVARATEEEVPSIVLNGLNKLQRTTWQVNERVLEVAEFAREHFDVQTVLVSDKRGGAPDKPLFMQADPDLQIKDMNEFELAMFKEWCVEKREWHTEQKVRGAHSGATNEAIRVANKFKGRPIWFVYSADYRGRFYASGQGISPQGNDLSKALLHFAKGAPIQTERGLFWFRVAGANKWAVDKLDKQPLPVRAQWVIDNEPFILRIADDPFSYREWTDADVPFQFLAWCFEYAAWKRDPSGFHTRIPLGQDGSCNGLQHFSAMLRDSVGGRATNLLPDNVQHDIYGLVASATAQIVGHDPDADSIALRWKAHELSRSLVKRSVMTLPYGSTRHSCRDFILKEYMDKGSAPEFEKRENEPAARWLSYRVWDGIGEVVVKGREAMEWLQAASAVMCKGNAPHITWRSPSGFLVRQRYHARETLKLHCHSISGKRIRLNVQTFRDEGDPRRHRNGIAPNFVHSCDASHMHLFLDASEAAQLGDLALIHDDYGCLADDVETLQRLLRETFVWMYTHRDPLALLALQYDGLPEIPAQGNLNLADVLKSTYFFC
jgi:DNA-directed RNA polymerase